MTSEVSPSGLLRSVTTLWPVVVLLVGGAAVVGEARYRLNDLEAKVVGQERTQAQRYEATNQELRKMNNELRIGLGKVQLGMARICIKLDVECD